MELLVGARVLAKQFFSICPINNKSRPVHFFYYHKTGDAPVDPVECPICSYCCSDTDTTNKNTSSVITPSKAHAQSIATETPRPLIGGASPENNNITPDTSACNSNSPSNLVHMAEDREVVNADSYEEERSIWWESLDAAKLFGFQHGDDVFAGIEECIKLLHAAVNKYNGYKSIVLEFLQ
jgi:hypothetical protein